MASLEDDTVVAGYLPAVKLGNDRGFSKVCDFGP